MSSIDERVVQMKFQNADFVRGVEQTLAALDRLNKGLQLQGVTKGLAGVQAVSKSFDTHIQQNRNSLGQFTSGVTATATATQQFGQKLDQNRNSLGQFTTGVSHTVTATQQMGDHLGKVGSGFSNVMSHIQGFGSRVSETFGSARQSTQGFVDGLSKTASAANAQSGSLKNLEGNVSSLASRFSNLGSVATGALLSIGARAQQVGTQVINAFTFKPVTDGFREYETNLNSIQTILANTQAAGTNLQDVTRALDELNHYSDQTIYNFSEMAKNIGTFTAAGVALEPATAAIKGIANLAALSGSNSEQASGAMYQLSQAISAGRVSLEDWNSVVNAGMGGTVFQRALAMNAEKMGTLKDGAVKLSGEMKNVTINGKSFRESITAKPGQESWLTSGVLTQTLAQFTGDLSDAELAAQGFSKAQIKAIQDQAAMAKSAATEVKTMTQLFGTFKEQLGSGWAQTWQIIFGDFAEAKGLFTGVSEVIGGMLQKSSDSRNKLLKDWDALGGRKALIDGIGNAFKALLSFAAPIKDAFREIFPATTAKQLFEMTVRFKEFTERLKVGSETADKIKRIFAGVFAVFSIGIDIIGQVVKTIFGLVGVATQGSGGFLNFAAKIGDWLVKVRNAIREGEGLTNLFKGIGTVLAVPIKMVQKFAEFLGRMFKDVDGDGAAKGISAISEKLSPMGKIGETVAKVWEKVLTVMRNVNTFFQGLGNQIADVLRTIGIETAGMFEGMDFGKVLAGINTGIFATLALMIANFFKNGPAGMFEGISDAIEGFTGTLKGMQNALQAATLLQIAIAVGILAISMNTLSKIDAEGLAKAGAAISVMFAQLIGSLVLFQKFVSSAGFAKMPFVMGSLILLAAAIVVLTQAVEDLAVLDWNGLAKGLTGVTVLLGGLTAAMKFMPVPSGMIAVGLGLIALAAAIKILASAVTDLSGFDWNELAKGLVGVGTLLGALVLFTMFAKVNKGAIAQGAGIILLAAGIKILASAVKDLSGLGWQDMAKGLVAMAGAMAIVVAALMFIPPTAVTAALGVLGVAVALKMVASSLSEMAKMSWGNIGSSLTLMLGALAIIAAALWIIPPTAPLAAAGVLIVAIALKQVAQTLSEFAEFSWTEILKSMVMLGGTMAIIAVAMLAMTTALPGAAATLIIAAALAILAPVLMQFSQMSLAEIGTALLMLAGVFVVFGAAALLLTPVVPMMIGLAAAITLLGIGMLAAGAGMFLFGAGLTAIAAAGAAASAAIIGIVSGLIGLIPELMKQIGLGIIAFAQVIATAGPAIFKAMVAVLEALIDAIVKLTPKIIDMLLSLMLKMLQAMLKYVPQMVETGMKLITAVLEGIARNIGKLVDAATTLAVNWINGIARNLPRIIQSGVDLILAFINGVTRAIDNNAEALGAAGGRLAVAIIRGMVKGLGAGIGEITAAARRVASSALESAKNFLGIHSPSKEFEKIGNFVNDGFREGLDGNKDQVYKAFDDLKGMLKELKDDSKASWTERNKAAAAYKSLTGKLNDEKNALGQLADRYDVLTEKIKKANEEYEAAVKTRDDYRKSLTDQYSDMASPTGDTKVDDYTAKLKKQVEDTKKFSNALQKLRAFGLNDEMYKDLLAQGTSALPFVEELLDKGIGSIKEINDLGKQLDAAGAHLGKTASSALYQAGVDSAKGLVDGLKAQQHHLEMVMDQLANRMVSSIKSSLGIKSPSREFKKVGKFSAEGLIRGLGDMSGSVEKASGATGLAAVEGLRKSLSGFSDLIVGDVEIKPVITPVLDLSSVRKEAGNIGGLLGGNSIAVDSAYLKARTIASSVAGQVDVQDDVPVGGSVLNYTQNNYSPKALSSAEIYRQTKNQLSITKGAL
ncbi:tape measure protein [Streptomyces phage LibertyBell]|nr:tape measure protein [Streptomyces phage LibertyBell]